MAVTVEITVDDDGNVSVGLDDEPSGDADQMQPAKSIGDALAMARHLLTQPQQSGGGGAMSGNAPTADAGGAPNGKGGGTGPDSGGATVGSAQDSQGGGDAKALWDQLAQMNMPQN